MGSGTRISEAEWLVMQVLWERSPRPASEVIDELVSVRGWNHRTVRTLLGRLVKKGVLEAIEQGNRNLYRPLVTRSQCVRAESRSFLDRVFRGDSTSLIAHFARTAKLSEDQIDELQQLLDNRRRGV